MTYHLIPIDEDQMLPHPCTRRGRDTTFETLPRQLQLQQRSITSLSGIPGLLTSDCGEPKPNAVTRPQKPARVSPKSPVQRKRVKTIDGKRVSFCKQVKVISIPALETCDTPSIDGTPVGHRQTNIREWDRAYCAALRQKVEERNPLYVQQLERILQLMVHPNKDDERNVALSKLLRGTSLDSPARGLEPIIFPNLKARRRHILKTVLKAQLRLPEKSSPEEKTALLSEVCLRLTRPSRQMARWLGAIDAKAVMKIVLESRGHDIP